MASMTTDLSQFREVFRMAAELMVKGGQLQSLELLEQQMRGWKQWTDELDDHCSSQRSKISKSMVQLQQDIHMLTAATEVAGASFDMTNKAGCS